MAVQIMLSRHRTQPSGFTDDMGGGNAFREDHAKSLQIAQRRPALSSPNLVVEKTVSGLLLERDQYPAVRSCATQSRTVSKN